jgi:UDP-glucose 4-epimerase
VTTALVVGGNGFLGSHLVDRLAADGHEVSVFDRFSTPRPRYDAEGVRAIPGDLSDATALGAAVRGMSEVYHFVSPTTPATAATDPVADIREGLPRSIALLQAAVDAGVERVVFASSGGTVYGDQPIEAFSELDPPAPVSPYAVGKLAVEGYLRYYRRTFGLDTVALRIANPYGPRQEGARGQGIIAIALHNIAAGRPVTVFGDGSMVRDYVHVDDVVATIAAMTGVPHEHEVYNVGSGRGVALSELLATVERATGMPLLLEHAPTPPSFVDRSVLDISRVVSEFGVMPQVSLDDGIAEVWRRWRSEAR